MSNDDTFRATRVLPQVAVATVVVAVLPVVVVWILLTTGVVSSPWVCVALAMALSFGAAALGSAYWKRRSGPGDLLFSELLLWGWLLRLRSERKLANAAQLLGLRNADGVPGSVERIERKSEMLTGLAAAIDAQDSYTHGHSRRVALHAAMIARRMGLSREEAARVRTAAAVHDVGKLRIPSEVLNKEGRLTAAEFEVLKRHAAAGAEIVACVGEPAITEMVRHHHERFDGAGYPAGLGGEQIPAGARIIAVADTFDALTSERPYREAVSHKRALSIVRVVSGTQLDPVAVRAFLKCYAGKRGMLFWVLLGVSPQRALAYVSGRKVVHAGMGSVATAAMPAALAALVAGAVGVGGSALGVSSPLRFAERPPSPDVTVPSPPPGPSHAAPAHSARSGARDRPSAKRAVLGITVARGPSGGVVAPVAGPPPSEFGAGASGTGSDRAGRGSGGLSGGSVHHGGSSHSGFGSVSVGAPKVGGSKKPPSPGSGSAAHPPTTAGTASSSPPPAASTPPSGGGGGGQSGGGGSGGGGQGGDGQGDGSGNGHDGGGGHGHGGGGGDGGGRGDGGGGGGGWGDGGGGGGGWGGDGGHGGGDGGSGGGGGWGGGGH